MFASPTASSSYGLFPLTESDRPLLAQHFLSLDEESRRQRFGVWLKDDTVMQLVSTYNLTHTTLGLFVWGVMVGCVSLMPLDTRGQGVELALSVAKEYQGRRWGSLLTKEALKQALLRGYQKAVVYYSRGNPGMAAICRTYPGKASLEGGEMSKTIDLNEWQDQEGLALYLP